MTELKPSFSNNLFHWIAYIDFGCFEIVTMSDQVLSGWFVSGSVRVLVSMGEVGSNIGFFDVHELF